MRKMLFLLFLFLISFFLFADSLSLEQARELALLNSRSLAKYNLAIQGNVLNEKSQFYSELPSFSLGLSAGSKSAKALPSFSPFP